MSNIIHFKASAKIAVEENLETFISHARDKITLWSNLDGFDWHADCWPTHYWTLRFVNFTGRKTHRTHKISSDQLMSKPFSDFAKAYLRYTQHLKPTRSFKFTIIALQLIEAALLELGDFPCITKVNQRHLDKACELLCFYEYKARPEIGSTLGRLAKNISQWHLTTANVRFWRHPFHGHAHVSAQKNKLRSEKKQKLPNDDAILALAEVFANGFHEKQDDEDIFITCINCLLLCAPMRISEILWFRTDLLRSELDSNGKNQIYLAYWVPKNGQYVRKEVPTIMADHAQEAVLRLKRITNESRRLALHYESGATTFYRHEKCPNVPDDQTLTRDQVVAALGLKSHSTAQTFLKDISGNYSLTGWTLNTLWEVILIKHKELNPHFPYQVAIGPADRCKPLKMSESLICLRYKQLSLRCETSPVLLAPTNSNFYYNRLHDMSKNQNMCFFRKHGYGDISLRSHQLRHFLNTMAQEAGVGIEQITQWSTRASTAQTLTYMHQAPKRQAQKIAEAISPTPTLAHNVVTDDEYSLMHKGPIITTRYGICTHDYTLTPCRKHADCLNCSELLLCKGHRRSIKSIQQERDRIAENLHVAKANIDAGERVAARWYDSHSESLIRINQLLQIMTDPLIEDGSPIQMHGMDFCHENRIIIGKVASAQNSLSDLKTIGIEYEEELMSCLRMLQDEDNV